MTKCILTWCHDGLKVWSLRYIVIKLITNDNSDLTTSWCAGKFRAPYASLSMGDSRTFFEARMDFLSQEAEGNNGDFIFFTCPRHNTSKHKFKSGTSLDAARSA